MEIASLSSAEKEMYRAEYDRLEQELLQSRSGNRLDSSASEYDSRASSFFESDSLKIDSENLSAANSSISSPHHPPNGDYLSFVHSNSWLPSFSMYSC